MSFLDQNSSEKRCFFAPSILQCGSNFAFLSALYLCVRNDVEISRRFPAFPQALTNNKTLGSSSFHIRIGVFLYMELVAIREVCAILSVHSLLFAIMEWTVEEVRQKIQQKYNEEIAKKFKGEIS